MVWPNFFLMNVFFALKGSKLFVIIDNVVGIYLIYYIQSSEIQENIVDIYCIFYIFTIENIKSYIFTPQECTYKFCGLPLTFPLTYCSALQNFKRLKLSYL